jgi:protein-tyrosine-phosphatase/predicted ATP-grasp superfamily ATP-dependent carboligase
MVRSETVSSQGGRPPLLITIDTEADNSWGRPATATTRNAAYLPRFQSLCEAHGLKVTYLVAHEMAMSPVFREFGQDVLRRGTGEIGMHLHAWSSPPLVPLTADDDGNHPYLIEYPEHVMREKIRTLTGLLEDTFGVQMRSHRAGRWALDETYARLLDEASYAVDCSVTPGVTWKRHLGDPERDGGADYSRFPSAPYFLDLDDISAAGSSGLLEVPVTILPRPPSLARRGFRLADVWSLTQRVAERVSPALSWLRPDGRNRRRLLQALDRLESGGAGHAEFILHSPELMPGGSPWFADERAIETLYEDMSALFEAARGRFSGATLAEYRNRFSRPQRRAPAGGPRAATGRVLVLGSDTRSFLSVVRSLGRRGLEVHAGWCPSDAPASRSTYIHAAHDIPRFRRDDDRWKRVLLPLLRSKRFDLVIPCNDPSLLPLQAHREEIEAVSRLAVPEGEAFAVAFDKIRSSELAASLGIPVPRQLVLRDPAQAREVIDTFAFPVVLKPRASFELFDLYHKNSVQKVHDPRRLDAALAPMLRRGDVLAQENFLGSGVGVEVLAADGDVLVAFQHVRLHEPLTGGGSSYRKSTAVDAGLLEATGALMRALRYTGVAMVEFKRDARTGRWIFVEINGRFWGSLPLALACGVDFPYYLYQLLVNGQRTFDQRYPTNVYARNLLNDVSWLVYNLRANRRDPMLATRPLAAVAAEVLPALALREHSDTFVLDDLPPAWREITVLSSRIGRGFAKRLKQVAVGLTPYGRRRAARVRARLRSAKTVVFVCKGNICRSPFAAAYARQIFPGARILSAGYHPQTNRPSPPEAVEAARRLGVDLETHRSVGVKHGLVREADVIITFDDENRDTLARRYHVCRGKTHALAELEGTAVPFADPVGRPVSTFDTLYGRIARTLDTCRLPS